MKKLISGLLLLLASSTAVALDTTLFSAASLSDALTEIGKLFDARGADKVHLSFAASSTLAKQIESGAPVALFISADEDWMDFVEKQGLVVPGTRRDLLANELVLIEPAEHTERVTIGPGLDLAGLLGQDRLAMGDPDSVPAGKYGKAALQSLGLWSGVEARIAPADSVRSALAFVERGEARFGIVYSTDAAVAKSVRIAGIFPESSHKPIVYPIGVIRSGDSPTGRAFLDFIQSNQARAIFQRYGFRLP
jgi:molybdate transport system substrate-binding protein